METKLIDCCSIVITRCGAVTASTLGTKTEAVVSVHSQSVSIHDDVLGRLAWDAST